MLAWVNRVDTAAITASSEAGNLVADNLRAQPISVRWRTTDLNAYVDFDFGADVEIGVVALRFYRPGLGTIGGTITHTIDADGGTPGAGAVYDSGAIDANVDADHGYHLHLLPTAATGRYWRCALDLSGPSFVDIGRAWAGPAFQPTLNVAYDYADFWRDETGLNAVVARRSGRAFLDNQPARRVLELPFQPHPDDAQSFRDLDRMAGTKSQVLACVYPGTASGRARDTVIGRFEDERPLRLPNPALYDQVMILVEDL